LLRFRLAAMAIWLAGLAAIAACTQKESSSPIPPENPLAEQGKRVYLANCIACHNPDPAKNGVIGPAIAGSSLELLKARVLEAKYPPGYKPKRESNSMAPLPHLKADLPALQAFLAAP
jgi:mono/diheme cytochrome c family protein